MHVLKENFTLLNGIEVPKLGFGTWQIPPGETTFNSVLAALKQGYLHIDTAAAYQNEKSVGEAIVASKIPREKIFVTSKLESHIKTYEETKVAFQKTLDELGLAYLDLYLIHAPWPWQDMGKNYDAGNVEAFRAMIELHEMGKIRAIGVSNFSPSDIENIITHLNFVPHVNQIKSHVGHPQSETVAYCKEKGILVEAYSPLGTGKALDHPLVLALAKEYKKTPAQLLIRYCLEKDTLPLPKTVSEARIIENSQVGFQIKPEDVVKLDKAERNY